MSRRMKAVASEVGAPFGCDRTVYGYHVQVTCICGAVIEGHVDGGVTNCGGPCSECALEWYLIGDIVDHVKQWHPTGLPHSTVEPLASFVVDDSRPFTELPSKLPRLERSVDKR